MSELDQAWTLAIAEAEERARAAGRTDISEYLALRKSNDLLRITGCKWLLATFEKVAAEANRVGAGIQISQDEHHRFKVGTASMVGSRLSLGKGLRMLFVDVGWPRAPRDGFIRGGGLASAHIKHRGMKSVNEDLRLVLTPSGAPGWILRGGKHESPSEIHEANVRKHISILLDDARIHAS
ncbi:MAG TPA: hypothetical protein DCK93_06030 [Blastocatellia bacterium]|nr:hypothetical protein [Blastocatellia bacterium]HAF22460.1 hypothetical protein [Blastocatellia bacterium]